MLFFVTVMTILASVVMSIASTSSRTLESHIRRTKAYYLCVGAINRKFDLARISSNTSTALVYPGTGSDIMAWSMYADATPAASKTVSFTTSPAVAPMSTVVRRLDGYVDYTLN